jgi:DNA polymerase-3 subunit gamma/tau
VFADVIGQRSVSVILSKMVERDKVPTALLFTGSRGCGKTSTARILAAALNCVTVGSFDPCGECVSCKSVYDGTSLDVLEIDAASNGLVADIRQLREHILYAVGGRKRVVLLDEAHGLSKEGFDALLKTLEEPPPDTVFVLLTTEPGRIPETVISRCMEFVFRRVPISEIALRLTRICEYENLVVDADLLTAIAERADGGLRDAIMLLDQLTRVGVSTLAEYAEIMDESDCAPTLLSAMAEGNAALVYQLLDAEMYRRGDPSVVLSALVSGLRDVVVLAGGGVLSSQGERLASRVRLVHAISPQLALSALRVLWDLKSRTRAGDDQRSCLDLVSAVLTETLGANRVNPSVSLLSSNNGKQRLTLEDMRRLVVDG